MNQDGMMVRPLFTLKSAKDNNSPPCAGCRYRRQQQRGDEKMDGRRYESGRGMRSPRVTTGRGDGEM